MQFQDIRKRFVTINIYHLLFFVILLTVLVMFGWLDFEEELLSITSFLTPIGVFIGIISAEVFNSFKKQTTSSNYSHDIFYGKFFLNSIHTYYGILYILFLMKGLGWLDFPLILTLFKYSEMGFAAFLGSWIPSILNEK